MSAASQYVRYVPSNQISFVAGERNACLAQTQDHDTCNRILLSLVARGNAIVTELHRLVELIPEEFSEQIATDSASTLHKTLSAAASARKNHFILDPDGRFTLNDVLCDYSYFKNVEQFEAKIDANELLKRADEEFCDKYSDIITRFYLVFESVHRHASELNSFIVDLEDEMFVGHRLDGLLLEVESRQLLCEAYYLLGLMLLAMDKYFEGSLRERLVVAYYRYSAYKSAPDSNLDETCNLVRSTGYWAPTQRTYLGSENKEGSTQSHRPDGYPESLFARVGVNQSIVNTLIAKMQSVDIYNQMDVAYHDVNHSYAALAQQASLVYVLLFFCPNLLKSQRSRMREIVDRYFLDNWIFNISVGELVNLVEEWQPYRAARESLLETTRPAAVEYMTTQASLRFYRTLKQIEQLSEEGKMDDEHFLVNNIEILDQIRNANVTLKWFLLHSQCFSDWHLKPTKILHAIVVKDAPDARKLCELLTCLAVVERRFLALYETAIRQRAAMIEEYRSRACETLTDLASIYSDTNPKRWMKSSTNLSCATLLDESKVSLSSIDFDSSTLQQTAIRNEIVRLRNQIANARDCYSDGKSLQVVQLFADTSESLTKILRFMSLPRNVHAVLQSVCDMSYAWNLMEANFTQSLQAIIKDDPSKVRQIESIFLKLSSAYDSHLMRIQQVGAKADLISVSKYYNMKLVSYICDVLHIIPATILELVSSIIEIQTNNVFGDMPSKIALESLKEFALPEKRYQMLELTYKISQYAAGMLLLQSTNIGLVRINSKQLLEDGIRRELVRKMSDSIQSVLQFDDCGGRHNLRLNKPQRRSVQIISQNLLNKLTELNKLMSGYKRSFEYIQDYLFIYGLRMWQEELNRILKFNLEQATLALLDTSFLGDDSSESSQRSFANTVAAAAAESVFQSSKAPIPSYGDNWLRSSFMMRLLEELLGATSPKETIFDEQCGAWYEQRVDQQQQHERVLDSKVFELIQASLGAAGLNAIDQLCCTLLMLEMRKFSRYLLTSGLASSAGTPTTTGNKGGANQQQTFSNALQFVDKMLKQSNEGGSAATAAAAKAAQTLVGKLAPHSERLTNHLLRVGQLQAIRMGISCVLSTKCRFEARNLYCCLETLNATLLTSLVKSGHARRLRRRRQVVNVGDQKEQTQQEAHEADDDDNSLRDALSGADKRSTSGPLGDNFAESQLMFGLANHLDWVGLSDPSSKIYSLCLADSSALKSTIGSEEAPDNRLIGIGVLFAVLLEQSVKFRFSLQTGGFVPARQQTSRSFYESSGSAGGASAASKGGHVDGQPLFYGIQTVTNHFEPILALGANEVGLSWPPKPLQRLIQLLGFYVKCSLDQLEPQSLQELPLGLANLVLAVIELTRLSRSKPNEVLDKTVVPQQVADTFQFTVCRLIGHVAEPAQT